MNINFIPQGQTNAVNSSFEETSNIPPNETIKIVKEMMDNSRMQSPNITLYDTNSNMLKIAPRTVQGMFVLLT